MKFEEALMEKFFINGSKDYHLDKWYEMFYKGKTKEEVKNIFESEKDITNEIYMIGILIGRKLTLKEEEKLEEKIKSNVLKNLHFKNNKVDGWFDLEKILIQ